MSARRYQPMTRPNGTASNNGQNKAPGHAEQRGDYVLQQQPVLQQVADSLTTSQGVGKIWIGFRVTANCHSKQQGCDERDRAETDHQAFRPLSFLRSSPSGAQSNSSAIARTSTSTKRLMWASTLGLAVCWCIQSMQTPVSTIDVTVIGGKGLKASRLGWA